MMPEKYLTLNFRSSELCNVPGVRPSDQGSLGFSSVEATKHLVRSQVGRWRATRHLHVEQDWNYTVKAADPHPTPASTELTSM